MILLEPNIPDQSVSVFVREIHGFYNIIFTNESTKQQETAIVTVGSAIGTSLSEGLFTFLLPFTPAKDTYYTLITRFADNRIMNYSMCYCGESLTQQYQRIDPLFTEPVKPLPTYNMPANG